MTNLLDRAISSDDSDEATKVIYLERAPNESDDVANYCFPKV